MKDILLAGLAIAVGIIGAQVVANMAGLKTS